MRVLIVDDEPPARERLRRILEDAGSYEVAGEAGNGEEALEIAARVRPDVVLLDIRMPGMDGIETAHHLNTFESAPAIVFTTAYDEYAIDAFDARAIGYVLKPVRAERLEAALEHAGRFSSSALSEVARETGLAERRRHVCARVQDELRLIPIEDVHYFIADQKYVRVHHDNGKNLIDDTLKSLEDEFDTTFVRVHRSALVAVDRIDSLKKTGDGQTQVILRDAPGADELVISRRHLAEVRRRLKGR